MIGEVAALDFCETAHSGKRMRIGITGTEEIAKKQKRLFEGNGAETVWICRSRIKEREFSFEKLLRFGTSEMDRFYKREWCEDVFPSGGKTTDRFLKAEASKICRNRFRYGKSFGKLWSSR